jgi:hypothetical protein
MGFKDLFKDVTDMAKDSIDSIQADIALKKEEQERLRAEMNLRIKNYGDTLTEKLLNPTDAYTTPLIHAPKEDLVAFTQNFSEKLLLPANGGSATKIDMPPYETKALENIPKTFPTYTPQEAFLFQFKDAKGQIVFLSTSTLYFKVVFPENESFFATGSIPAEKLFDIALTAAEDQIALLVNGVSLITAPAGEVKNFDLITLTEYLRRLRDNNFSITPEQVDAFIQSKLDPTTLEIVKAFLDPDEKMAYFVWGLNNLLSKKFLVATDKKIVLYDRDQSVKKVFPYSDIQSLTTLPSTVSFLDLSLTLGMNPNDTEIKINDAIETINILYRREAEQLVKIYHEHKPQGSAPTQNETSANQPAAAEPNPEDPIAMIEKLAVLKEKGIISEAEFIQKKQELLAKL